MGEINPPLIFVEVPRIELGTPACKASVLAIYTIPPTIKNIIYLKFQISYS